MKKALLLLIGVCLVPAAVAEEAQPAPEKSAEALEIVKKVDAAAKAVRAVRYSSMSTPGGAMAERMSPMEGTSVMVGWIDGVPEMFRTHVKTKNRDGEPVEVTGGGNGDMFFLIDHTTKKAYEDMDPAVVGSSGRVLRNFGMLEYVHDTPFTDEIEADGLELQGTETVAGVECYKVHVTYAGGNQASTWFFGKEDYLPRRRIRHVTMRDGQQGTIDILVSKLEIEPDVDAAEFKFKLPEGYEQIDDFAP